MRKIIPVTLAAAALAGCTTPERAAVGAATGAVVAGPVGAVAGAAIGAASGPRLGPRYCWARDAYGRRLRDAYGRPFRVRC
jgi:hypothetical protein